MKTWIRNAYIISMDSRDSIYPDGCVMIENDKITYVGCQEGFEAEHADRIIDAKGNIVMPGLVNAHTHLPMTIFKGYGEDLPLQKWLEDKIWPAEDQLNDEIVYWSSLLGLIEMAKTGTTCFLDMYMYYDAVYDAMQKSGHRGVFARAVMDIDGGGERRLKDAEDVFEKYKGRQKIDVMASAHAEYTCSSKILEQTLALAKKYDAGIHIHISETQSEHEAAKEKYGLTPIQLLDKLKLTEVPVAAAHCVYVDDIDIEIMADKGVSVLSCPQSNLKLGSGIAPIKKMMDHGVNIAVGTDGSSSNNNLDMLEETMLVSMLQKGILKDAAAISNMQALKMATVGGAKALNKDKEIGQLKAGYLADLIMIDTSNIEFVPRNDLVSCIINSGCGRDVCMTMIGGDIIYQDGKITFIEEQEVISRVQEYADQICI